MNKTIALVIAATVLLSVGGCSMHHASKEGDNKVASTPRLGSGSANWTKWNNGQRIGSFYAVAGTAKETVAVGIDGLIATRNNATGVWTTQTFAGDPDFRAIVYAKNQYVIVREAGSIMTSPDGLTWASRSSPTSKNLLGVFWDGHQYLAGGDGGTILSSPDGIEWTSRESGTRISFYNFSYSGTRYVAVGNDGIRISSDSSLGRRQRPRPRRCPSRPAPGQARNSSPAGSDWGEIPPSTAARTAMCGRSATPRSRHPFGQRPPSTARLDR